MSQPTEIIVYRNPLEAALWNSADGNLVFPIMCAMLVMLIVVVLGYKLVGNRRRRNWTDNVPLAAGFASFCLVIFLMV